ncbi:MAG: 30S ribosomal protein S17, partial [Solirubrobacteraceae bacterium]
PEERHAERLAERAQKAVARRAGRAKSTAKAKAGAHQRAVTPPREHVAGQQKVRQGVVVADKADKTITVRIDTARRHRRYEKIVRTSRTLHAHDERNEAHVGDTVVVRESRPLSRSKRWRLIEVLERAR